MLLALGASPAAAKEPCPRDAGLHAHATPANAKERRAKPIALSLEGAPSAINFAYDRDLGQTDVVVKAARAIPRRITPGSIVLDVPRRLQRDGGDLLTVNGIQPTFSVPRIAATRDRISFVVCVSGDGLKAGSYAGVVTLSGPRPLGRIDVPVTVHVKHASFFWLGAAFALLTTLLLLAFKELRNDDKKGYAAWKQKLRTHPKRPRLAYFLTAKTRFGLDFWLIECIVPIGAAFGAMYAIYAATPTWGVEGLAAWFSLLTAAFAAAGVRSLIVAVR
jgi:hypothetical protein